MASRCFALPLALLLPQSPPQATFRNLNDSFHIELPAGWRQLAPNEASDLAADPDSPLPLRFSQPRRFYAVGPVEDWRRGDFRGAFLQVVEVDEEWYVGDDFAGELRSMWQQEGDKTGVSHELAEIRREKVGSQQLDAVVAVRTSTPKHGPTMRSLDVHAPSGGQQVTLCFTCPADTFTRWQPEFRRWLDTVVFARVRRQNLTLGERLQGPLLTGGLIGLALFFLYRHTRRRR